MPSNKYDVFLDGHTLVATCTLAGCTKRGGGKFEIPGNDKPTFHDFSRCEPKEKPKEKVPLLDPQLHSCMRDCFTHHKQEKPYMTQFFDALKQIVI